MTLKEVVLIRSFACSYLAVASVCITQSTILHPKPWSIQTSILIEINIILSYNHSHPKHLNLHSKRVSRQLVYGLFVYDTSSTDISSTMTFLAEIEAGGMKRILNQPMLN